MADTGNSEGKKGSLTGQIVASVAVALLVGGTSPWWVNSFFKKPAPDPVHATVNPPATESQPAVTPAAQPSLEPSDDFFVGRWRVDQEIAGASGGNVVDYYKNGRFSGKEIDVYGNQGRTILESGRWELEKLSERTFRLTLNNDNGTPPWIGQFKILDWNHIQNIDQNYVAERVE